MKKTVQEPEDVAGLVNICARVEPDLHRKFTIACANVRMKKQDVLLAILERFCNLTQQAQEDEVRRKPMSEEEFKDRVTTVLRQLSLLPPDAEGGPSKDTTKKR